MHPLEVSFNAIAKTYGVSVCHCQPNSGSTFSSYTDIGGVCISECDGSEEWYFKALHEVGHIACRHGQRSALENFEYYSLSIVSEHMLECEAEAWLWALDHACGQPSLPTRRMIARCFGSYARDARDAGPLAVALVERVTGERVAIPA